MPFFALLAVKVGLDLGASLVLKAQQSPRNA